MKGTILICGIRDMKQINKNRATFWVAVVLALGSLVSTIAWVLCCF